MGKIIILGNTWHGNWSLSLYREMERLGYTVEHVDVRLEKYFSLYRLESFRKKLLNKKLYKRLSKKLKESSVDTCVVMTPYTVPISFLNELKAEGVRLVGWWGDDPMIKADLTKHMPLFDHIYLVDNAWIPHARFFNSNTSYLPHAASSDIFRPLNIEKKYDVSFIGDSFGGNMNGTYRARSIDLLRKAGVSVALFGDAGWKNIPEMRGLYQGFIDGTKALNEVYNASHIALNIHHSQLIEGTNQRSFEAALSGTLQIADKRSALDDIFGKTIPTYNSPEELVTLATSLLADEEKMKKLRDEAKTIAQTQTYTERIAVLLGE